MRAGLAWKIAFSCVALYWFIFLANHVVDKRLEVAMKRSTHALLLDGVRVDLKSLGVSISSRPPVLLFFISDTCAYCKEELPKWKELLRRRAFAPAVPLLIVTKDGAFLASELESSLKAAQLRYEIVSVTTPKAIAFSVESGIMATPTILLLDADSAIRFSASRLTPKSIAALEKALAARINPLEAQR